MFFWPNLKSTPAVQRYEQSGPCYELQGEPHCLVAKRADGPCRETVNGQIHCPLKERGTCQEIANGQVRCDAKDKRGNCWETPNGQIQCNDVPLTGDDGSSTQNTTTSQDHATDEAPVSPSESATVANTDPNTDLTSGALTDENTTTDVGTSAPVDTCVVTADGRLECGNVMSKRGDHDGLERRSPRDYYYASCPHGPDGVLHCRTPSTTTPGNGGRSLDKRIAVAGEVPVPIKEAANLDARAAPCPFGQWVYTQYARSHWDECLRTGAIPKCIRCNRKRDVIPAEVEDLQAGGQAAIEPSSQAT
ncbi:MAG: hypothetical protein Q9216_005979, partial [Gyalolechia sp. 2 TL-2023]